MSTVSILLPLLAGSVFGLSGGHLSRTLPPSHATWLISAGAVACALSSVAVLALVGSTLVGQLPELARLGRWSTAALREHAMTDPDVGAVAAGAAVGAVLAALWTAARTGRAVRAAYRAAGALGSGGGDVAIVTDGPAQATALPGRPGRVVVSRSLLSALSAPERRIVLAHERAHLRYRHHWHRAVVNVAAGANPLLLPLRAAVTHATERWADEASVSAAGDRRGVADAVAKTAVLTGRSRQALGADFAAGSVPARVAALLAPAPQPRPVLCSAVTAGLIAAAVAAIVFEKETEHVFELAGRIYRADAG